MKFKTVEIEADDWIECYHVFINCPYCGELIEVVESDWYNEIEKCKCNKCGKTFRLKTNNFVGVI